MPGRFINGLPRRGGEYAEDWVAQRVVFGMEGKQGGGIGMPAGVNYKIESAVGQIMEGGRTDLGSPPACPAWKGMFQPGVQPMRTEGLNLQS